MSAVLQVQSSLLSTIQDLGRIGAEQYGVPRAGAIDRFAFQAANILVGNHHNAPALEITLSASFSILRSGLFALTGADLGATLDQQPIRPWCSFWARAGQQLTFSGRKQAWGARTYLAIAGGFEVEEILGSASTFLQGNFGGFAGRALRSGDQVHSADPQQDPLRFLDRAWPEQQRPAYQAKPSLRLIAGPHAQRLPAHALETLCNSEYRISANSNRMGYRLEQAPIHDLPALSLPSLGVFAGVIQLPPDGNPILLMADAQTTGGYPIIGVVCQADLPLAAQLLPGDSVQFRLCDLHEAQHAGSQQQHWLTSALAPDTCDPLLAWAGSPAEFPED